MVAYDVLAIVRGFILHHDSHKEAARKTLTTHTVFQVIPLAETGDFATLNTLLSRMAFWK